MCHHGACIEFIILIDNGINGSSGRMLENFPKYVTCEIIWYIHMVNYFHRCGPFINQFYNCCVKFDIVIPYTVNIRLSLHWSWELWNFKSHYEC